MKKSLSAAAALLLAACAQNPQTAEEFRAYVPTSSFAKVQTIEAKRPFREVTKTFQAKAPECLNVAVRMVERSSTSSSNILTTYKPTVLVSEQKAELHVQRTMKGNVIVPGKVPEGGLYYLVADATPLDRNRTRVDIYAPTIGADTLVRAVTGWATGENVGCPDLTK
ncbi:MAG TPA: hypothetical protein VEQ87_10820 [Burkholderiales bacterium]|nr:hypothetical protein [Burkholderiales bacterium]